MSGKRFSKRLLLSGQLNNLGNNGSKDPLRLTRIAPCFASSRYKIGVRWRSVNNDCVRSARVSKGAAASLTVELLTASHPPNLLGTESLCGLTGSINSR